MESAIYIVATPIGNLADITLRALDILKQVDLIAAEDTRHTRKLLDHYGIESKLVSYHDHNERDRAGWLIEQVKSGASVALVSDAGTPLISDPGYTLVSQARRENVSVVPVPGVSALITALSVSGMPSDSFLFDGFLPVKQKAKKDKLLSLQSETRTMIFYESPRRIVESLEVAGDVLGDRLVSVARELTKRFETVVTGRISEVLPKLSENGPEQKGEFVFLIGGVESEAVSVDEVEKAGLLKLLLDELPPKKASAIAAEYFGVRKKEIYDLAVRLKG